MVMKIKGLKFFGGGEGDNPGNKDGADAKISRINHKEGGKRLVALHECLHLKVEQNTILSFWHAIIHVNAVTVVSVK